MSSGSLPGGASMPASSSRTELAERADNRLAITQPAEPPPTMMKSKPPSGFPACGETVDMSNRRALHRAAAGYGLGAPPASALATTAARHDAGSLHWMHVQPAHGTRPNR